MTSQTPAHPETTTEGFVEVAEMPCTPDRAVVYEHGWQSWSPAGVHRATATSPRPARPRWQTMAYRPETPAPDHGMQGEGLLVVQPDPDGPSTIIATDDPHRRMPSIRATVDGDRIRVTANGEVAITEHDGDIPSALAAWGDALGRQLDVRIRPQAPGWCSWYCHGPHVTDADVVTAVDAAVAADLPIDVVQVDDGYQADIGDWLDRNTAAFPRPLSALTARIADAGMGAGLWTAPFCVGANSALARQHPDWLVGGALASDEHWGQPIRVLDVTHPDAAEHLVELFSTLRSWGFDYHKIDFVYAGALPGRRHADIAPLDAYGEGLRLIREAIGPDATLLGCGAPLLPSVGRVDAMRISPDIDPVWEPPLGDVSQPSMQGALQAGRARAWQHGRLWINDPDCVLVREEVGRREEWAGYLDVLDGLAVSSDHLDRLDARGLEVTRHLLRTSDGTPAPTWQPDVDDADAGRLRGEPAGAVA
ncbi:glycoside hydrolase family 36 protein [Euzebya rosea]|uniref:glycoside hydrolase family 36 protein n=1 Tax=Euzebya rosea TaxID=2052804 RepID=UPI00196B3F0D|nr:glycoside hydrolase family 36 protein [Euzebya rosea]